MRCSPAVFPDAIFRHVYDTRTWTSFPVSWPAPFANLAWSPDSTRIVGGDTLTDTTTSQWTQLQRIAVWSVSSGKVLWNRVSLEDLSYLRGLVWSPDGIRIASCGTKPTVLFASNGGVRIWDATTGQQILTYTGHDQAADLQALAGLRMANTSPLEAAINSSRFVMRLLATGFSPIKSIATG